MDMNLFKPNATIHDEGRGPMLRNNPKYETIEHTLPSINMKYNVINQNSV
jgi:hypothetical protein